MEIPPSPKKKARDNLLILIKRDGSVCHYCRGAVVLRCFGRNPDDATLDHKRAKARGGQHTWDNLVVACRKCNHEKADRDYDVFLVIVRAPGFMAARNSQPKPKLSPQIVRREPRNRIPKPPPIAETIRVLRGGYWMEK